MRGENHHLLGKCSVSSLKHDYASTLPPSPAFSHQQKPSEALPFPAKSDKADKFNYKQPAHTIATQSIRVSIHPSHHLPFIPVKQETPARPCTDNNNSHADNYRKKKRKKRELKRNVALLAAISQRNWEKRERKKEINRARALSPLSSI